MDKTPQSEKTLQTVKRAVLIGINYFGSDAELSGCINDILDVKLHLESCGFTDIIVLTDTPADPTFLLKTAPTRANILAALDKYARRTMSGDTLYVHYSGHGSQLADQLLYRNGRDEKDGFDETICPVDMDWSKPDNNFIRDDDLNAILVKKLATGAKLRVVFDSCHSGSALDLPLRWTVGASFADENVNFVSRDVVFMSGCKDNQTSADSQFNDRANGALTWALLKSLSDIRKLGTQHSWKNLTEMVRDRLKRGGYDQIPQISFEKSSQLNAAVDLI
jgi:hypothetical protein